MQESLSLEERELLVAHKEAHLAKWEQRLKIDQARIDEHAKLLHIASFFVVQDTPGGDMIIRIQREQFVIAESLDDLGRHAEVALCGACFQRRSLPELRI